MGGAFFLMAAAAAAGAVEVLPVAVSRVETTEPVVALTFDACDVRVSGDAATATCQGSARYVPKVGSREPRVEPRVWNFTLRKNGSDWQIATARAER